LTRHSRQLLADAYLETGISDTHNLDHELDGPIFQHAMDEDIDLNEDDNFTDSVDKSTEEMIYRFGSFRVSLISSMLTEVLLA
jgi:hypothetical protein